MPYSEGLDLEMASRSIGIILIGPGPLYTRQTCMHVENEFDIGCKRLDHIEQAWAISEMLDDLRLIVVDERHAEDLAARPERYCALHKKCVVAVSYRDADMARDFYKRWPTDREPVGFLPMKVPLEVWLSLVRLLMHKEVCLPVSLLAPYKAASPDCALTGGHDPTEKAQPSGRLGTLTAREKEVLQLVSAGQSNKIIARRLAISEHTVKLHLHHLSRKIGASNRTEAASLFLSAQQARP